MAFTNNLHYLELIQADLWLLLLLGWRLLNRSIESQLIFKRSFRAFGLVLDRLGRNFDFNIDFHDLLFRFLILD